MAIQKEGLIERGIYRIHSRNLDVGVWNYDDSGFIGIREKFDSRFLFQEYLSRECGGVPSGIDTVTPIELIGFLDDNIQLKERLGSICRNCGGKAWWLGPPAPADWTCEGKCAQTLSYAESNQELFDALDDITY